MLIFLPLTGHYLVDFQINMSLEYKRGFGGDEFAPWRPKFKQQRGWPNEFKTHYQVLQLHMRQQSSHHKDTDADRSPCPRQAFLCFKNTSCFVFLSILIIFPWYVIINLRFRRATTTHKRWFVITPFNRFPTGPSFFGGKKFLVESRIFEKG